MQGLRESFENVASCGVVGQRAWCLACWFGVKGSHELGQCADCRLRKVGLVARFGADSKARSGCLAGRTLGRVAESGGRVRSVVMRLDQSRILVRECRGPGDRGLCSAMMVIGCAVGDWDWLGCPLLVGQTLRPLSTMGVRMMRILVSCLAVSLLAACAVSDSVGSSTGLDSTPVTLRVFTPRDTDSLRACPVGTTCLFSGSETRLPAGWVVCRGQVAEQAVGPLVAQVRLPTAHDLWLPCSAPMGPPRPGTSYSQLSVGEDCAWGWEPHPLHVVRRLR
jgi:hypothetical protein